MIGKNIKKYRRLAKLTQAQLAEACKLSRVGVSDIERGLYDPSIATLRVISKALNTNIEILVR